MKAKNVNSLESASCDTKTPSESDARRRWFFRNILLALFWCSVLTAAQHAVIRNEEVSSIFRETLFRFLLNYFAVSAIVTLFPRWLAGVSALLCAFAYSGAIGYANYFGKPPMFSVLTGNFSEGLEVGNAAFVVFPPFLLLLSLGFAVAVLALAAYRDHERMPWKYRFALCLLPILIYAGVFQLQNRRCPLLKPPQKTVCEHAGTFVAKFGILPAMFRDAYQIHFLESSGILEAAIARESEQSNLLQDAYGPEMPNHIVVLQVESLDYPIITHHVDGKAVMPFLRDLSERSLLYHIRENHEYGSATADFVMLNGIPPAEQVFNYSLSQFPYNTALPAVLRRNGYRTYAVHGVRGSFYNRRTAFEKMGIEHNLFRAELWDYFHDRNSPFQPRYREMWDGFSEAKQADHRKDRWIKDELVLEFASWLLQEKREEKLFLFLITATTHEPFIRHSGKDIRPDEKSKFDRYGNAMNELDGYLRRFYENLPDGTLLVLYGDHPAYIRSDEYKSANIPLMISVKGGNLKEHRRDPKEKMTLRDAYSYVKRIATPVTIDRKTMQANAPEAVVR